MNCEIISPRLSAHTLAALWLCAAASSYVCFFSDTEFFLFFFLPPYVLFNLLHSVYRTPTSLDNAVLYVLPSACAGFLHAVPCLKVILSLSLLSAAHSVTVETCRQVVTDLHSSLRKTVMLYATVSVCASVYECVRMVGGWSEEVYTPVI